MNKVEEAVRNMIGKLATQENEGEVENFELSEDANFIDELSFDSIKFVILMSSIEDEFEINFSVDEMDYNKVNTLRSLLNLIEEKIVK